MKINELNKPDQLEEGPVWDKVKQLGAGTKGFFQGGATGARAGYNAQGTANQMTGKIKDISMLVLNKWQEFNQAYKMANGGQDAGAEEAVAWFIKFTGGQKPNNPNPPTGDSPAYIQKWLQQEIANTMAQRAMAKVQGELPDITKLNREELLQLRQQLTATGLNEDILNEVDWSKVKNAVAGGAISLAALGLPGLANADAQKMTPEQIRAWVQQSVKNKTPLQAQQIVNKLNVAPTADTPAAATPAPIKAEPVPPTVDPSVARKAVSALPPGGASKPAPVAKAEPAPVAKADPPNPDTKESTRKFLELGKAAPYKISRILKRSAFDGDSVKFTDWTLKAIDDGTGGAWLVITGAMNGKNRLGAYVGYKNFFATVDPDNGEIQKLYMEGDPAYAAALALMATYKTPVSARILGPN
jgi:hypothetical protein